MEGMLWITQAAFQEEGTLHGASLDRIPCLLEGGHQSYSCYILLGAIFVLNPCLPCLVPTA